MSGVLLRLFVSEQRTELFQLERALGIRIERVSMDGESFEKSARARRPGMEHTTATSVPRMVRLPGEFLQAQTESNFRREIDRRFWRWSYTETHKCAIMDVPRLLVFRNLSIYLRGS